MESIHIGRETLRRPFEAVGRLGSTLMRRPPFRWLKQVPKLELPEGGGVTILQGITAILAGAVAGLGHATAWTLDKIGMAGGEDMRIVNYKYFLEKSHAFSKAR